MRWRGTFLRPRLALVVGLAAGLASVAGLVAGSEAGLAVGIIITHLGHHPENNRNDTAAPRHARNLPPLPSGVQARPPKIVGGSPVKGSNRHSAAACR
jgi:hypothetical protein